MLGARADVMVMVLGVRWGEEVLGRWYGRDLRENKLLPRSFLFRLLLLRSSSDKAGLGGRAGRWKEERGAGGGQRSIQGQDTRKKVYGLMCNINTKSTPCLNVYIPVPPKQKLR